MTQEFLLNTLLIFYKSCVAYCNDENIQNTELQNNLTSKNNYYYFPEPIWCKGDYGNKVYKDVD